VVVTVKLGGNLREKVSGHEDGLLQLNLPEGATLKQALGVMGLQPADVKLLFLNHCPIKGDVKLKHGDRLGLFPPQLSYNTYVAVYFRGKIDEDTRQT